MKPLNKTTDEQLTQVATSLYELRWDTILELACAQVLESISIDIHCTTSKLHMTAKQQSKQIIAKIKNNADYNSKSARSLMRAFNYTEIEKEGIREIGDIIYDLFALLRPNADLSRDNVNLQVKNFRKLIDSLRKKTELRDGRIEEWKQALLKGKEM